MPTRYFIRYLSFCLWCSLLYSCESLNNTLQNPLSVLFSTNNNTISLANSSASPYIPPHIQSTEERAQYLLKHFWDERSLADTTLIERKDFEHSYTDYCGLLVSFPADSVKQDIVFPLEQSNGSMLLYALSLYQSMLYDTSSPTVSEDHYRYVLEWMIRSPKIKGEHQDQAKSLLSLINKNRVGSIAEDFIYTKADGSRHHLKNSHSAQTLLILVNPNTPNYHNLLDKIARHPTVSKLIQGKQLSIKVIYVQTSMEQFVLDTEQLPKIFEAGYDAEDKILTDQLYNIKTHPTMYLIDRKGQVLLKEASLERLEQYLLHGN